MDKERLDHFREKLIALRERIVGELTNLEGETLSSSPRERAGDLSGYSIHLADAASDSYNREFSLSLASREQEMLNRIEKAIGKTRDGTYGVCELCPDPIGEGRLEAVPYAELCLACKRREEEKRQRR